MSNNLLPREIAKAEVNDEKFTIRTSRKVNPHARFYAAVYQYDGTDENEVARWNGTNSNGYWKDDADLLSKAKSEIAWRQEVSESDIQVRTSEDFIE